MDAVQGIVIFELDHSGDVLHTWSFPGASDELRE